MKAIWRTPVVGVLLLAACTTGSAGSDGSAGSAKALPLAAHPTPGVNVSLDNLKLATGEGVSIGLHPTEAPITLRATSSMALSICPDDDSDIGTGLSWPLRQFTECCTFPTEATNCFRGLAPGRPATVRALHVPSARAVVLYLAWP